MTIATFGWYDEARWLEVCGHAGFTEPGKDIVCAAVSITVQSLAAALSQTEGVMCDVKTEDGRMFVVCRCRAVCKQYVEGMFEVARMAFELLTEAYPEHVKLV